MISAVQLQLVGDTLIFGTAQGTMHTNRLARETVHRQINLRKEGESQQFTTSCQTLEGGVNPPV